jgi:hypothetical protein
MADTNHSHTHAPVGADPVEGDGVSYRGIGWFVVVLALTTFISQGLMAVLFKYLQHETVQSDPPRPALAAPAGQLPPAPNLLYLKTEEPEVSEPGNLARFREQEESVLHGYAIDNATGTVRIPIERAKALLLERGLPVAGASPQTPPGGAAPAKAGKTGKTGKTDQHEGSKDHERR